MTKAETTEKIKEAFMDAISDADTQIAKISAENDKYNSEINTTIAELICEQQKNDPDEPNVMKECWEIAIKEVLAMYNPNYQYHYQWENTHAGFGNMYGMTTLPQAYFSASCINFQQRNPQCTDTDEVWKNMKNYLETVFLREVNNRRRAIEQIKHEFNRKVNELRRCRSENRKRMAKIMEEKEEIRNTMNDIFLWNKPGYELLRGELDEKS